MDLARTLHDLLDLEALDGLAETLATDDLGIHVLGSEGVGPWRCDPGFRRVCPFGAGL